MKTALQIIDRDAYFVLTDLDSTLDEIARAHFFTPFEGGLAKRYPADTPHLERIFANFERYAEPLFLQKGGLVPCDWEAGLLTFLQLVDGQGLDWYLVGSAALSARGLKVAPGDIDFVTAEADAPKLGELALDYLVQPVEDSTGWISKWFARAYMHTCVEWVGGVNDSADAQGISDFGPVAMSRLETIEWRGYPIRVPPLDLQLAVNQRRGKLERAALIESALKTR